MKPSTKEGKDVTLTTHTVRVEKRPTAKKDAAKIITTRDVKVKK